MNRRQFLRLSGVATAGLLGSALLPNHVGGLFGATTESTQRIALLRDPRERLAFEQPVRWAASQLLQALKEKGFATTIREALGEVASDEFCIIMAGGATAWARDAGGALLEGAEALGISAGRIGSRNVLLVNGSDARGLMYALLEVAESIRLAASPAVALNQIKPARERPANSVRSVMRMFASDVEDKMWFYDRPFWQDYFSLLAAQRFNRFNLAFGLGYDRPDQLRDTYLYFAYPFLVKVPGYDVRATNLPDAERDRNLEMLRFISDEAAHRGLDFQLGLWTHAYQWNKSPEANHLITGLTPQTQAPYSRDAMAIILKECPNITGVTLRIHGESGVAEGSYDLWRTIFDGAPRSGRPVGLDLHAKGMDQPTLDAALATNMPVTISPKFWAEHLGLPYHQAAIRPMELPQRQQGKGLYAQSEGARSFLRYGYGDLHKEDRKYGVFHRVWPGSQKVLLWGDPAFAAGYGRVGSFCGTLGFEIFDPLSFKGRQGSGLPGGRDGYVDSSLRAAGGDFEKYRYPLSLWGRMLYNPETDPEAWQRQLRRDYGAAASAVEISLAHASRILPLVTTTHLPSGANLQYWPEMYTNMSIVDASHPRPYTDTPAPRKFGTVSPLDSQLFSRIDDYAQTLLENTPNEKYSPLEVAQWLEDLAETSAESFARAESQTADKTAPVYRRFAIDVSAEINLGRFFAQKFRSGILYALYERTNNPAALTAALKSYRAARDAWAQLAKVTTAVYVTNLTYGGDAWLSGHWADRLAAIDQDIIAMEAKGSTPTTAAPSSAVTQEKLEAIIAVVQGIAPARPDARATHAPPAAFRRGQPVSLAVAPSAGVTGWSMVRLHYRQALQSETWKVAAMVRQAEGFHADIPGNYTDSPYPLIYYFEISTGAGQPALFPGLGSNLTTQPYFAIPSAAV